MALEVVGGAFLSAALAVLFDRMASRPVVDFIREKKTAAVLLHKLKMKLLSVNKLLDDAEEKQLRNFRVRDWLSELKDVLFHVDDLLDEIMTETLRCKMDGDDSGSSSINQVLRRLEFSSISIHELDESLEPKILEILERLELIVNEKDVLDLKEGVKDRPQGRLPTTSLVEESSVYGRDEEKEAIIKLLLADGMTGNKTDVLPIVGMGSASDADGQGTSLIHPSSQTVIVEDIYGSDPNPNRSPFHSTGSHDYNYVESHQATGHYDPSLEPGLIIPSTDANIVANQHHHGTRVTTSVWIFSATGLAFEAVSAFFDQVASPQKPQYSLYGMLLSIVAVLVCILDLIHNIQRQRGLTSASNILWGILPEIFGLALACTQCISSALQFLFLCRHAANPMKMSLVPFLFFFVLFAFKYREGRNRG